MDNLTVATSKMTLHVQQLLTFNSFSGKGGNSWTPPQATVNCSYLLKHVWNLMDLFPATPNSQ